MALTAKKVYAILKRQISDMEAKIKTPIIYRGTVATADLLPENPKIGDMYNIESKSIYGEAGMNVAWNGVVWDTMGAPIDMSLYFTKEEAETVIQRLVTEYFEKNPVKPGATTEQAQQIEQNKTDIASLKTETNSLKESISTKITKFYASSQGETHLADSDDGKIMDMMLYGKSEQKQYSGKNLLNYDAWKGLPITRGTAVFENNGVTLTATENDCYTEPSMIAGFPDNAKIKVSEGETLTLSWEEIGNKEGYIYILGNGIANAGVSIDNRKSKKLSYTVPSGVTFITFRFGVVSAGDTISYKNIQIEKGSEPTTYEPYTGGIPSPNPSYPQEIKSVVNPTVKVYKKNLLKATLESTTKKGITCTNNGDGTYTLNGTANGGNDSTVSFNVGHMIAKSGKYIVVGCPNGGSNEKYNLRIGKDNIPWGTYVNSDLGNGCLINVTDNTSIALNLMIKDGYTCNNVIFKPMIVDASLYPDATYDDFEPYHEQTVTLPYTLNAIPVSSGGNVTIDGQQYVSDYFDVERGKLVRMCKEVNALDYEWTDRYKGYVSIDYGILPDCVHSDNVAFAKSTHDYYASYQGKWNDNSTVIFLNSNENSGVRITYNSMIQSNYSNLAEFKEWLKSQTDNGTPLRIVYALAEPEEIDLAAEEIAALKALATYYPTTNISVNSEQLDGYTVFNYPISMENGWNYVKQQLNDNRDYIYDMDARTQDTDLQAAEAYVNSEYAVALTELEV